MTQVLDCTIRDGGYYTGWDFDADWVDAYLAGVAGLPIDYVEVGYVNHAGSGYAGEYFYLGADRLRELKAALRPEQKLVIMADGKSHDPENVESLFAPLVGIADVVRVTATPQALPHAMSLTRAFKGLGFESGLNVMYLSSYQDDLSAIDAAIASPEDFDSIALVDSYGGCTPESTHRALSELRRRLPERLIGFHGHDNMCLAFANTLAAIDAGADIVDGTLAGMGRGAGNLRTETLLVHRERTRAADEMALSYGALSTALEPVEALREEYGWGTSLPYMISGANSLPQKDVMDWLSKKRYTVSSIIDALQRQSGAEADSSQQEELAVDVECPVLVIGGGPSVTRHAAAIARFATVAKPTVLFSSARHLSLSSSLETTQYLCLPGHEAERTHDLASRVKALDGVVVPSPPRVPGCVPEGLAVAVKQAEPLHLADDARLGPVSDVGPLALTLGAVAATGAKVCYLVGFEGYRLATAAEQSLAREVQATLDLFKERYPDVRLVSLTPSMYDLEQESVYAHLAGH